MNKRLTSKKLNKYARIIFIIGVIYTLINIYSFISTVGGYLAQGYVLGEVLIYLVPSQLLPTVIEPFVIFWGISLILFGISAILSKNEEERIEEVKTQEEKEETVEKETETKEAKTEEKEEAKEKGLIDITVNKKGIIFIRRKPELNITINKKGITFISKK